MASLRCSVRVGKLSVKELRGIEEEWLDVVSGLGRRFAPVLDVVVPLETECRFLRHLTFWLQVLLSSDQKDHDIRIALSIYLVKPGRKVIEGLPSIYWVTQNYCMGRPVEDFCDGSEGLLAGRVPNLQLKESIFNLDTAGTKVNTHRNVVLCVELVFGQTCQNTWLADA